MLFPCMTDESGCLFKSLGFLLEELVLLNVAFLFPVHTFHPWYRCFDKAVEWKGMFFMGCSRIFHLKMFHGLPSLSGLCRL